MCYCCRNPSRRWATAAVSDAKISVQALMDTPERRGPTTGDDDEEVDLFSRSFGKWCCAGNLRHKHLLRERADSHVSDLLLRGALHDNVLLM